MDTLRWLRKNGEIIGCEENGIEYTVYAIVENNDHRLHLLYHDQIRKDKEATNAKKTNKRKVCPDYNSWGGVRCCCGKRSDTA